jgi:hypothetical protein
MRQLLVGTCHEMGTPSCWRLENGILLIDGLDELAPALSEAMNELLLRNTPVAKRIVLSSRSTHPFDLRYRFIRLSLSRFSAAERDEFFRRWFRGDPEAEQRAVQIIKQHRDVAENTRLPLMATLVAALVENGYYPTTRLEIYQQRLKLLLGDWDRAKGLSRMAIHPRYKLRYLKALATFAQEHRTKFVTRDHASRVFTDSLGRRGHAIGFEQMMTELVRVCGVLIEQSNQLFGFGHLSFQEHLVGEALFENKCTPAQIYDRLDDAWWEEPLMFFAAVKEDLTDLIDYCEQHGTTAAYAGQLKKMMSVAPYTSSIADEVFRVAIEQEELTTRWESVSKNPF